MAEPVEASLPMPQPGAKPPKALLSTIISGFVLKKKYLCDLEKNSLRYYVFFGQGNYSEFKMKEFLKNLLGMASNKYQINKLMLSNFKAFEGEHWFNLKDLTLITGANNSGKSSLINGLKLISAAFMESDFPNLNLHQGVEQMGTWDDVLNFNAKEKYLGFGFKFNLSDWKSEFTMQYGFKYDKNPNSYAFSELKIYYQSDEPFISFFNPSLNELSFKSALDGNSGELVFNFRLDLIGKILDEEEDVETKNNISFFFNAMKEKVGDSWWGELFQEEIFYDTNWKYKISFKDVFSEFVEDYYMNFAAHYEREALLDNDVEDYLIDSYRAEKSRIKIDYFKLFIKYFFRGFSNMNRIFSLSQLEFIEADQIFHQRIIPFGRNTHFLKTIKEIQINQRIASPADIEEVYVKIIKEREINETDNKPTGLRFIGEFQYQIFIHTSLKFFGIDGLLFVEDLKDQAFSIFLFTPTRQQLISDLGKGTAKLITIILKTASIVYDDYRATPSPEIDNYQYRKMIFIEEPEAFLHPDWQSRLADYLAFCIKKFKIQFIIESHSEYLVRKLQYLTAKKKINPEQLNIYYLSDQEDQRNADGTFKELHIKENGQLSEQFGSGFYDEATRLMMSIFTDENIN